MNVIAAAGRWAYQRPYLLLSLTMLAWAGNVVLGRFVAGHVPPVLLAQVRWSGAFILILPFAWPHLKRDATALRQALPVMLVLSFTGITLYNTMAYVGLQFTQAINGLLMQSTAPLLIGFWSLVLFRDRLSLGQIAGILTSLAGVLVIIARGDPRVLLELEPNPGDLWIVAALIFYALYSALLRRRPGVHWLSFLAFTFGAGQFMLLPATIAEHAAGIRPVADATTFATLAYVVIFPSLLAYLCFNRGVELIGANRAGPFFHLIPVFGSLLAILFLGERPALFHAVGYAMILSGIVLAQQRAPGRSARERP